MAGQLLLLLVVRLVDNQSGLLLTPSVLFPVRQYVALPYNLKARLNTWEILGRAATIMIVWLPLEDQVGHLVIQDAELMDLAI